MYTVIDLGLLSGLEVEVDYDSDPPEPQTGYQGGITLNNVRIGGCYVDRIWEHSSLRESIERAIIHADPLIIRKIL